MASRSEIEDHRRRERREAARAAAQRRRARRRRALVMVAAAGLAGAGAAAVGAFDGGRGEAREATTTQAETPAPTTSAPSTTETPAPAGAAPSRPPRLVQRTYGAGDRAVTVVRPERPDAPLPVVLFLHGWGYTQPGAYRGWIRHLARRGNAVIVPAYQTSAASDPAGVRAAMLAGFRTALRRLDNRPSSLVVAGHSAGAALAADYATVARSQGLPRALAVFAVFPGRAILGTPGIPEADPARMPSRTRLTVLAGTRDTVVGQAPARALVAAARAIPRSRRRLVVVRRADAADHEAPLRNTRAARRVFWRRLDRLIGLARSEEAVAAGALRLL